MNYLRSFPVDVVPPQGRLTMARRILYLTVTCSSFIQCMVTKRPFASDCLLGSGIPLTGIASAMGVKVGR